MTREQGVAIKQDAKGQTRLFVIPFDDSEPVFCHIPPLVDQQTKLVLSNIARGLTDGYNYAQMRTTC